jgi:hypothetical protein
VKCTNLQPLIKELDLVTWGILIKRAGKEPDGDLAIHLATQLKVGGGGVIIVLSLSLSSSSSSSSSLLLFLLLLLLLLLLLIDLVLFGSRLIT